jgi:hypothetical protein
LTHDSLSKHSFVAAALHGSAGENIMPGVPGR